MASTRILTPRGWRKTSRRCASLSKIRARKCPRCNSKYEPQRKWQKFCSRKCRWAIHDNRKSSFRKKVRRVGTDGRPFGAITCPTCKERVLSTRPGKKYCSWVCYKKRMSLNWHNKNRRNGTCYDCSEPPINGTVSRCRRHWLTQAAWRAGVRAKKAWRLIENLLKKQNGRCPYTGRRLVPGKNASLDHINPRSLYPKLQGKISNLEWVDLEVNRAKRALSRQAFISLCRTVAKRFQKARP